MIDISVLRAQLTQVREEAERSRIFTKSLTERLRSAETALDMIESQYKEQEDGVDR